MTTTTVTSEQFAQITTLLRESQTLMEASRSPHLTLAQKLAFQKQSKDIREQALAIGKENNQ